MESTTDGTEYLPLFIQLIKQEKSISKINVAIGPILIKFLTVAYSS